ncbi:type II secretion system protein E [Escherichia coli]|uniref:Type II secretion system protein E n=1 Tax=Escherichia coli TaxID=562 RepID=A0A376NV29_ECOLX|nr:type II secretion system protein E [Escherichia coli]
MIRFRVDGTLHEMLRPGRKLASLLVSRIKVMARLDIAEKRVPQDGRIALLLGGRAIDVRVSTMPSAWGERVVLRLLDKNLARLTLERLGLSQQLTAPVAPAVTQTARHLSGDGADGFRQKHHAVRRIAGAEQPFA